MEGSRIQAAEGAKAGGARSSPAYVQITPSNYLTFNGNKTQVRMVKSEFHLKNLLDKVVIFKVKTTRPHSYCVRPNSGYLNPSGSTTIEVIMQSFEDLPTEAPKHKFQVQAAPVDEEPTDVAEMWKRLDEERTPVQDKRLKCIWQNVVLPDGRLFNEGGPSTQHSRPQPTKGQATTTQRRMHESSQPTTTARRSEAQAAEDKAAAAAAVEEGTKSTEDGGTEKKDAGAEAKGTKTGTQTGKDTSQVGKAVSGKAATATTAAGKGSKTPSFASSSSAPFTSSAMAKTTAASAGDVAGKKGTIANLILILLAFVLGVAVGHYVL